MKQQIHFKFFSCAIISLVILFILCIDVNVKAENTTTTLLPGTTLSSKMKTIANNNVSTASTYTNTNVKAIKKANYKKENLTDDNIISTNDSENKVYMWFENETLYYYTDADIIYMNSDSSYAFRSFSNLTDISGLEYFDTSKVINLGRLFIDSTNLTDISPIKNWNTSNVTNMYFTFGSNYTGTSGTPMKLSDLTPLTNWDTSNVTTMNSMFKGCASLKTLDALKNWNVSKVTEMTQMFNRTGLVDASGIQNWDVSNVTNFNMMLTNIPSTTVKPIFTYRAGYWQNNGTYVSNPKQEITVTIKWPNDELIPNNIKIFLKKENQTSYQASDDSKWTKNGTIWTYKFAIYDSNTYYVFQEEIDGFKSDSTESSAKKVTNNTVTINNTINKHIITLKTQVTGNMASIYNEFEYTIFLYDKKDNPLTGNIKINYDENITLVNGSFTKKLKNDEYLTINDIPENYKYKIIQTNTDYTESYILNNTNPTQSNETEKEILNSNNTITFINNKQEAVKTGITTDIYPMLLLVFFGISGLIIIKYHNKFTS